MAKSKFLQITSPKGEALYPYLKEPEVYQEKALGYTIQAKFPEQATTKLIQTLEDELERAKNSDEFKGKKFSKEPSMGYRENKDGDILFKFKSKHEITTKSGDVIKRTVPIFDANLKPCDVNIGNGSIIRITFQVVPFWMSAKNNGITLFFDAIQVIELKERGAKSGEAYGFAQEDGFSSNDDLAGRFEDEAMPDSNSEDNEEDF